MKSDHEQARLRATYADLLEGDDTEELLPFLGALDAAHSTPPLPNSVRAALDQPRWATQERPLPATTPDYKARPMPLHALTTWVRDRLTLPQRPPSRRWANLHQAINAMTTIVLVLGIALAAFLLLGQPARPGRGNAALAKGNWVYPGMLDGRSGIISVAPDGTARLLIEGGFYGVTPSPDGQRLIAYGNRDGGVWPKPTTIAALYTAEGQLLRRYTLGGSTPLIPYWSPDSRHIAFYTGISARVASAGDLHTWLLDENGERELQLGWQTRVGTSTGTGVWSSRGELLLSVIPTASNGGNASTEYRQETWIVQQDGSKPRRLSEETRATLGWSPDGRTAYLLDATVLTAVDVANGSSKVIASFADVIAALRSMAAQQGVAAPDTSITGFAYFPAAIAPSGDRFAIWLIPEAAENAATAAPSYLVVLDAQGQIVGATRGEANTWPRFTSWSPDSAWIAYSFAMMGSDLGSIHVVGSTTTVLAETSVALATIGSNTPDGLSLRWSPDSQQLAFSINGLVEVASGNALSERRRLPGLSYGWPNWQPMP